MPFLADECRRRCCRFRLSQQERADDGVRADIGALVALDAVVFVPDRDLDGDHALLVLAGALREGAVLAAVEGADRQLVAVLGVHDFDDILDEGRDGFLRDRRHPEHRPRQPGPGFRLTALMPASTAA